MHIHLTFGSEKMEHVIIFSYNFVTVADVIHEVMDRYDKKFKSSRKLLLFDEYNHHLKESDFVEKGRSYKITRSTYS